MCRRLLLPCAFLSAAWVPAARGDANCSDAPAREGWAAALGLLESSNPTAAEVRSELWSRWWLDLTQQLAADFEGHFQSCPEGTTIAFLHALPAFGTAAGESLSLEVVKYLYHQLNSGFAFAMEPSAWQKHWLAAVASLVNFAYGKWVNVPQDEDRGGGEDARRPVRAPLPASVLVQHHRLLFRTHVEEFRRSGVYDMGIAENSVLFSEAFAFVAFCRLHGVDTVLESGVYKGFSSELWSHFVDEVVAVDLFPDESVLRLARERLRRQSNVQVVQGNGKLLLPQLLDERKEKKVAVFIDGPKGELAIRLALDLLRDHPQVPFVAMHDMAPYRSALRGHGAYFFTDEPWFREEYGHLDEPFRQRPDLEAGGTMAFLS